MGALFCGATVMANSPPDSKRAKTPISDSQHEDNNLYDPLTLARMSRVLEVAWKEAQEFYGVPSADRSVRIAMAARIIEAIEAGVRDEESLKRAALTYRLDDTD